jgi:integration host factor subunit beta
MTKSDLIDAVAKNAESLTKKQTEVVVETIFDSIKEALTQGDKVEIRGFGNFRLRKRDARKARNPKTGVIVDVPAKMVPFFKVGKELSEMVDSHDE